MLCYLVGIPLYTEMCNLEKIHCYVMNNIIRNVRRINLCLLLMQNEMHVIVLLDKYDAFCEAYILEITQHLEIT